MGLIRWGLGALLMCAALSGCVAAECREGSREVDGKCVADEAGSGGSAGEGGAGEGGTSGSGGSGGMSGSGGSAGSGAVGDEDASMPGEDAGTEPVVCDPGFEANSAGTCVDVDECTMDNGGCDPLALCTNTPGSRTCGACPAGYTGDGDSGCLDVDECLTSPCDPNATCTNQPGTYACTCAAGFMGDTTCTDIDECTMGNGGCDPLTLCMNTPGSRTCGACPAGYTGDGLTGCVDADECALGTDDCDEMPSASCSNTPGDFTCACPTGYMGAGRGANGCQDVNECASNNGGCDTMPMVSCTNTDGGRTCGSCPSGFTGSGVGANGCQDVNECASNNGGCDQAATCTNTAGGRTCGACPAGYTGNGSSVNGCVPQLSSLRVTPGLNEAFSPAVSTYSLAASAWLRFVEVDAASAIPGAVVRVGDLVVDAQGRAFHPIGTDPTAAIPVTVTDTHGRSATYTLNMSRRVAAPAQTAYIKTPSASGTNQYFNFGMRLAMSGDTLIASRNSPNLNGSLVEVFVRSGDSWTHQATLDPLSFDPARLSNGFGRAGLDIDGDVIAVGDVSYPAANGALAGGVHIFRRTGTTWARETTLTLGTNVQEGDNFGWSVALSGNVLVVGMPGDDSSTFQPSAGGATDSGAAWVYERRNGGWTSAEFLKATVARPGLDPAFETYPRAGDQFGYSVDVVGDTVVVGAPSEDSAAIGVNQAYSISRDNSGAVYTYRRRAAGSMDWDWQSYIKPTVGAATNMSFGVSVSMGTEQSMAVGTTGVGAYVFHAATTGAWLERELLDDGTSDADAFGYEVRMWGPGMVVVGAPLEDSSAVGVGGTRNNSAQDSGAAYVFSSLTTTWASTPTRTLIKSNNAEAGDGTVSSSGVVAPRVAIVGDVVVTTAPNEDSSAFGVQVPGPTADADIDVNVNYGAGALYTFR